MEQGHRGRGEGAAETLSLEHVRGYVDYLRDLGVGTFYRGGGRGHALAERLLRAASQANEDPEQVPRRSEQRTAATVEVRPSPVPATAVARVTMAPVEEDGGLREGEARPRAFDVLRPLPEVRATGAAQVRGLEAVRAAIGDCTRCPLAYAGRHTIVFGEGNADASLMFVGEGPGAEEDATGRPFVGKAGQLLDNMIGAMGLRREAVYIANVVKCRPPQNRTPEPAEANTCAPFLLEQIDLVQPKVIVALGATAATYLLGVRQSINALRGAWHSCRGAKVAVTFHPAYLLRDPRQKGEAWKDLQRVMTELGLKPPVRG